MVASLPRAVARLVAAERRARGTRRGSRALTCYRQAPTVLVWFRTGEDKTLLGPGFGVSRATTDCLTETTASVKGEQIDAWYSGKHRASGADIQAIM